MTATANSKAQSNHDSSDSRHGEDNLISRSARHDDGKLISAGARHDDANMVSMSSRQRVMSIHGWRDYEWLSPTTTMVQALTYAQRQGYGE